ncbi:MAG TPA: glycosyl hydrolase 115 family protein [Candidatus Acidoferrum sp.]|nr:glycosyl hydrolase 115 family protein [Candidatus Acidoferrum sp.]
MLSTQGISAKLFERIMPLRSMMLMSAAPAIAALVLAGACFVPSCTASQSAAHKANDTHSERSSARGVLLDRNAAIFISPDEEEPVQKAIEDLAADFQSVFGVKPRIIHSKQDAAPLTIVVGQASKLPNELRPSELNAPESFSIALRRGNWKQNVSSEFLVLSGADMRGTIYAVYQFSEKYLGVDPLYYWTDHVPLRRASISLPASLQETYPSPVFKYRGFFINDEDLLTGWAPGEKKDKTGIALDVWNKIFETILRLKGNMVAPGTWIFPDDPQVQLAYKRGLIIAQHHAIPLGLNVARWPKDVPYNYTEHPEILERAWKNAVNSYLPNQEVLWTVGLRGLSDVTYASMDPSVRDNNQALGALISKAISNQMKIVRAARPDAKFVTNLWQEGARLVQQGDLKIPPEVPAVWADDGYGYLQDHGEVTAGQGIYDHVAMMNGRANQLTEMVPVSRSFSEIGRYIKAGATNYFLVNTSDIRPVPMSIRAVMDAVWAGVPNNTNPADEFYEQWAAEEFGDKAAPQLVELYKQYFSAPAHFGEPPHEYGDQLFHTEARRMLLTYMIDSPLYALPSQAPKWEPSRILDSGFGFGPNRISGKEWLGQTIGREIKQCGDAQSRWDAVWQKAVALEPSIPIARRNFYREQVLAMIAIQRDSNRVLFSVSKAIQAAQLGNKMEAHQQVAQALAAFDEIRRAEDAAEYAKWKNWYRGDWLTGIYRTRELVQIFSKFLDDPETHIAPPVLWDGWEAYYHIMHYEEDRNADVQ